MEITVTVMIYSFAIVTFSFSHGGSHLYESLMVGVRVHSLLSTPHELSQLTQSGIAMSPLHASLYLSTMTPSVQVLEGFPNTKIIEWLPYAERQCGQKL